jgi:predicted ATPase
MIKRLYIKNYKSMREIEVFFEQLMVVFGPNAVGKSNLFDALNLVSRMVSERSLKEAFADHRGLPLESIHIKPRNDEADSESDNPISQRMVFEVDLMLSPKTIQTVESRVRMLRKGLEDEKDSSQLKIITNPHLRYRIEIEVVSNTGETRVCDERLVALKQNKAEEKARGAFLEMTKDSKKKQKLSLRLEGQSRPTLFDVGLNYSVVSTELYAPHYPHISAFREELKRCHIYYFEPRELMREATAIAEVERPGPFGEGLAAFYNTLQQRSPAQYKNLKLVVSSILPRVTDISIERTKKGELYLLVHEDGNQFSNRLVSEGTLRVLGLVGVVSPFTGSTTVGYEEPENGVHPRRLNQIADLLKNAHSPDRQILVNTHSPILPRYFENKHLMVCSREDNQSVFKPFTSLGPMFKPNEVESHLDEKIERGDFGG